MSYWSSLPDEIKGEVLKFTSFLSSHRLRLCSNSDLEVVDSLKTKIPFLKIELSSDNFTLLIIQDPSEILRIDLKLEENSRVRIFRSESLQIENNGKLLSGSFEEEVSNLLNGIFQRKLEIESCLILNREIEKDHPILQLTVEKLQKSIPKRLILSGKSYSETLNSLDSLRKSSEIVIRLWTKDESKKWNYWKNSGGLKVYEISRWKTKQGVQEHVNAAVGIGLISYFAHIQSNPQKRSYWVPGFHVEDLQHSFRTYEPLIEKHSEHSTFKIPVDTNKTAHFKFSKCGFSIQVGDSKSVRVTKQSCDLEWMCPNCSPNTMENWFYRETIGNLH